MLIADSLRLHVSQQLVGVRHQTGAQRGAALRANAAVRQRQLLQRGAPARRSRGGAVAVRGGPRCVGQTPVPSGR